MASVLSRPFHLRSIDGQALPVEISIHGRTRLIAGGRLQLQEHEPLVDTPREDGVVQWELYGLPKPNGTPSPAFLSRQTFRWLDAATLMFPVRDLDPEDFMITIVGDVLELRCVLLAQRLRPAIVTGVQRFTFVLAVDAPDLENFVTFVIEP